MGLNELIETCDNIIAGDAKFDEIKLTVGLLENILAHIKDFVDETNYSPVGYPVEYLNINNDEGNVAIIAFGNILEEMESYFCE